jgi:hypothetical protein
VTPALIAAQERRLARIAELDKRYRRGHATGAETAVLAFLIRLVRLDARLWT